MQLTSTGYTADTPLADESTQSVDFLVNLLSLLCKIDRRYESIDLVVLRDVMELNLDTLNSTFQEVELHTTYLDLPYSDY